MHLHRRLSHHCSVKAFVVCLKLDITAVRLFLRAFIRLDQSRRECKRSCESGGLWSGFLTPLHAMCGAHQSLKKKSLKNAVQYRKQGRALAQAEKGQNKANYDNQADDINDGVHESSFNACSAEIWLLKYEPFIFRARCRELVGADKSFLSDNDQRRFKNNFWKTLNNIVIYFGTFYSGRTCCLYFCIAIKFAQLRSETGRVSHLAIRRRPAGRQASRVRAVVRCGQTTWRQPVGPGA